MRQQIEVTGNGIVVTSVTEPLVSAFGKVMRAGTTDVVELPWDEIANVSVSVTELPPDRARWVSLTVDTSWGEFVEVHEQAEGYADAVRELCRRSGRVVPDGRASSPTHQVIWSSSVS